MKRDSIEDSIAEYTSFTERGYAAIIANSGKIIAAITAAIAALVTFADISFLNVSSESFTSSLIVMLISSYLIYFSLEDAGERLGKESKEYINAQHKYDTARAKIEPEDIAALREYSVNYAAAELEYRIKSYLCKNGYSYTEFSAFSEHGCRDKRAKRVFTRVSKMKSKSLSITELLSASRSTRGELVRPGGEKAFAAISKLLPSTLCMIFTASVILTTKSDLTASVIIESLLKLSALPVIGFRAYVSGFNYTRERESAWLETKSRILEGFIREKEKSNLKLKSPS